MSTLQVPAQVAGDARALRLVLRNAAALLLAYVLPRGLTFGSAIVAARVLAPESFGIYGSAAALAVIVSILATAGMTPLLVREIARTPARAPVLLAAAHAIKGVTCLAMFGALLIVAPHALESRAGLTAALLLTAAYAVGAYAENFGAWFQAMERMHVWTQASAAFGLVSGGLGAALVLATKRVEWFCVGPLAGQLAAVSWAAARVPPADRGWMVPPRTEVVRLLRGLAPFAAAFIALTVFTKLDVLLLARWSGAAAVGVYAAAYKFLDVVQALAAVAAAAVYPRLARAVHHGAAGTRLIELTLLVLVPAAGVLWLLRAPIVALLYGDAYAAAVPVLGLLAIAMPLLGVDIVASFVLAATGGIRAVAAAYAGTLLVRLALDALLIPARGAQGAAAAMLLSEAVLAVLLVAVLRLRRTAVPRARIALLAAAAALAGVAVARYAGEAPAALVIFLATVAILYVRGRVITPAERALLAAALARPRAGVRAP